MAKKVKPSDRKPPNNTLYVGKRDNEDANIATARTILGPDFRHAVSMSQVLKAQFGNIEGAPGYGDYADAIHAEGNAATKGQLAFASRTLAAQAMTLDTIFTEMARRMALNMGEYLGATETYARIALKAQAQSRATLETLAKLHQPREQTVRHVHVNEGGQAVIAEQFHHYAGGHRNAKSAEQPHAAGTGAACSGPAMLGHDAQGNGLPIPGDQGGEAMPDARRQGQRRT